MPRADSGSVDTRKLQHIHHDVFVDACALLYHIMMLVQLQQAYLILGRQCTACVTVSRL